MNYYISYPLYIECNLHCWYCWFKKSHFDKGIIDCIGITPHQWCKWRDLYLKDAEIILVEFNGGETFLPRNVDVMDNFLYETSIEQIDLLTNGLMQEEIYVKFLKKWGSRLMRLGMSYHASIMNDNQIRQFKENAHIIKKIIGNKLYIKEILVPERLKELLESKKSWEQQGYLVKVQDFKPIRDSRHHKSRSPLYALEYVDIDYLKPMYQPCSCRQGYKTIIIQSRWNPGDILACWHDPVVVGNIIDCTYNPNYIVEKLEVGSNVCGVPKQYNPKWLREEGPASYEIKL